MAIRDHFLGSIIFQSETTDLTTRDHCYFCNHCFDNQRPQPLAIREHCFGNQRPCNFGNRRPLPGYFLSNQKSLVVWQSDFTDSFGQLDPSAFTIRNYCSSNRKPLFWQFCLLLLRINIPNRGSNLERVIGKINPGSGFN